MKNNDFSLFCLSASVIFFASCSALSPNDPGAEASQNTWNLPLDPFPTKPRVTFNKDGTLKLTVFSDLHYGENPWDDWGPEQDKNSTRLIKRILAEEKPDFAIINGDLVTGENTFRANVTQLLDQIVGPFNLARVPFTATYGNHDNQGNITHFEEILHLQKASRYAYVRSSPAGVGGEGGQGNYWVPIYHTPQDNNPVLILWFFDSRGGVYPNPESNKAMPDWVDSTVGPWIEGEVIKMEAAWGPSTDRAALAFVHIPPHAIQAVQSKVNAQTNPGLNDDKLGSGSVQDSAAVDNDGPFWDSLTSNIKNLRAIISGHDHGNEWCAREPTKNVIFCFNKHSGYGGYDSAGWGHGVRNLLFRTPEPTASVETWIRLEEGEERARVTLDDKYDSTTNH
ncbi:Metallo-dependent phosphatase [Crepidotus variabilis]|uniref:Metallo-dependent phosphatase n=1 Tax=Crepidotus variabilis TaxID=179855 RepID=A0A9P6EA84_9AGAR|nr:Metallo-dependent phosphatase [Crepidotus variabilis]